MKNECDGKDDSGLKAATGSKIAVELDIEGIEKNEWDEQLGDHPQHALV